MLVFPWFPLFVLFSPAFFILCFAAWCFLWWAMECESGRGATAVVVLFLVAATVFGGTDIWQWIYQHPAKLGIYAAGYVILGMIWSVMRWILFCHDDYQKYMDIRSDWLEKKKITDGKIPDNLKEEWVEYVFNLHRGWAVNNPTYDWGDKGRQATDHYTLTVQQTAKRNKARIMTWMAYWPFSATWWVLRDFLRKLWDRLYRLLGGVYDRISAWIYKGVDQDSK